jgi:phosphate starvation-inducible membrane PsiE
MTWQTALAFFLYLEGLVMIFRALKGEDFRLLHAVFWPFVVIGAIIKSL